MYIKNGGSPHTVKVMVAFLILWGCSAASGPGDLVKVSGIMNSIRYHKTLSEKSVGHWQKAETVSWLGL